MVLAATAAILGVVATVDADQTVVGMLTRGDGLAWAQNLPPGTLGESIATPVVTGSPDEPVGRLADRMAVAAVGRAPVTGPDGRLVGLVSRRDLLRARVLSRVGEVERQRLVHPPLSRRRSPATEATKRPSSRGDGGVRR